MVIQFPAEIENSDDVAAYKKKLDALVERWQLIKIKLQELEDEIEETLADLEKGNESLNAHFKPFFFNELL